MAAKVVYAPNALEESIAQNAQLFDVLAATISLWSIVGVGGTILQEKHLNHYHIPSVQREQASSSPVVVSETQLETPANGISISKPLRSCFAKRKSFRPFRNSKQHSVRFVDPVVTGIRYIPLDRKRAVAVMQENSSFYVPPIPEFKPLMSSKRPSGPSTAKNDTFYDPPIPEFRPPISKEMPSEHPLVSASQVQARTLTPAQKQGFYIPADDDSTSSNDIFRVAELSSSREDYVGASLSLQKSRLKACKRALRRAISFLKKR